MNRLVAGIIISMAMILWTAGYASAGNDDTSPPVDAAYIKEHYPEAYRQIFLEGKEAGKAESSAVVKQEAVPPPNPAAQAKPALGAWWEKNSLTYSPLPEQWLFHVEGTLDYKRKNGNTDSSLYHGSTKLMVRKRRFTNTLFYAIDKELSEPTSASPKNNTDTDYRTIQDSIRYDLTDRLYGEGGYMWEKDTANLIAGRNSYYGGLGYALLDGELLNLELYLGGGYEEEKFPDVVKRSMHMSRQEGGAGYFREDFRWKITDRITYKQTFRIIQNLNESSVFNDDVNNLRIIGETNRYRWFLINEIYFSLTAHLSFMTGYKIEYDSNPWPTVQSRDETVKSGIQFSF